MFLYVSPRPWNVKGRLIKLFDKSLWKMIFIDINGDPIQCAISAKDVSLFLETLQEGKVYSIEDVMVECADRDHAFSYHSLQLRFTQDTKVREDSSGDDIFPTNFYKVVGFEEVYDYLHLETRVIDVVGVVVLMGEEKSSLSNKLRNVVIMDTSCIAMKLTLWDSFATEMVNKLAQYPKTESVMLACGLHVYKDTNGVYLSSGRFTRLYVNSDDSIIETTKQWYNKDEFAKHKAKWIRKAPMPMDQCLKITNAERARIFRLKPMPMEYYFRVLAEIVSYDFVRWYEACHTCGRKVVRIFAEVRCPHCRRTNVRVITGVMVKLTISDGFSSMKLILCIRQVETMFRCPATQLQKDSTTEKIVDRLKAIKGTPFVFVIAAPGNYFNPKLTYIASYVIHVDWAEEAWASYKRRFGFK